MERGLTVNQVSIMARKVRFLHLPLENQMKVAESSNALEMARALLGGWSWVILHSFPWIMARERDLWHKMVFLKKSLIIS